MDTINVKQPNITQPPLEEPSEGYLRFIKAANPTLDEITMILRCHLLAEFYMNKLIIAFLPRGDVITDSERPIFMFNDKLVIVKSFDILPQHLIDSLRKLNSVRNKCGHELDYEVTESDVDKIGHPFGIKYVEFKKKAKTKRAMVHNTLMLIISNLEGHYEDYIKSIK